MDAVVGWAARVLRFDVVLCAKFRRVVLHHVVMCCFAPTFSLLSRNPGRPVPSVRGHEPAAH